MTKKGRFKEARFYVAGSSVAMLLGIWGLLAAQDAHYRSVAAVEDAQQSDASVATVASATPAPQATSLAQTQATAAPVAIAAPQATTAVTHTRTQGS